MKKRSLVSAAVSLIFMAALAGCGEVKAELSDIKGTYDTNGYLAANKAGYPDVKAMKEAMEKDNMKISKSGALYFGGKDYKLVPEGVEDGAVVFSVEGSGFDFDKYCNSQSFIDKDYDGAAYLTKKTEEVRLGNKPYHYDTYTVYMTAEGDEDCSAYILFTKHGSTSYGIAR